MLLLNKYTYQLHMPKEHSNMLHIICYKNYAFLSSMLLGGTYIVVHVNYFVLYYKRNMCVHINISYSCQLLHTECGHHNICCHGNKYITIHSVQQFIHDHIIPLLSYKFLYFHHISNTSTCVHEYMHTCVEAHMHACTCEKCIYAYMH